MGTGYTRFSAATRQTGGDSDGISHKPSKKLKRLSTVGIIDQSSMSKRVKLPKKFFDDCHTVNLAPIPRKSRSAMNRHYHYVSPSSSNPKGGILRLRTPLEHHNKKLEFNKDERQHSTISESISEETTKDEEEAIAGLLLLAGNNDTNEINLRTETSNCEDLVKKSVPIEDLNKSTNTVDTNKDCKDFGDQIESRKICSRHVYICQMIKQLQVTEVKTVNSHKESKIETIEESIAKEAIMAKNTMFQDKWHGCGIEARRCSVAKDHTSFQVSVPPYFGSPLYDPSQWPREVFPRHQMWMNPLMAGGRYQNWQKIGHETMTHHSGSKHLHPLLLNLLGSKENGGLFLVDRSPTLNLACYEHLESDRNWLDGL